MARVQDLIPCVIGPWHYLPSVHVGPEQSEEAGQGYVPTVGVPVLGQPSFHMMVDLWWTDGGFMVGSWLDNGEKPRVRSALEPV